MVQVQSSWFPLYDRNPQTFVDNIFWAKPDDYKKATQRVYHSSHHRHADREREIALFMRDCEVSCFASCQPLTASLTAEENLHELRNLGNSDLRVPPICLGSNVYGWTLSEADTFHQLDHALDAGLNFVDTADVYSRWAPGHHGGESETILGKWFAKSGRRKEIILATKVGMEMAEGKKGLSARYIAGSGRCLTAPPADRLHRPLPGAPRRSRYAFGGNAGRLRPARKGRKVRSIGASNYTGRVWKRPSRPAARMACGVRLAAAALQPGRAPAVREPTCCPWSRSTAWE